MKAIIVKGKYNINKLVFDTKTSEYIYIHKGVEMWREKGDTSLYNLFLKMRDNSIMQNGRLVACEDYDLYEKLLDEREQNPMYQKYIQSCEAN